MSTKLDMKKELRQFYRASPTRVAEVDVPPIKFLMIDGKGDPNKSDDYRAAVEALFSISYRLKFGLKNSSGMDYTVMPLECLWSSDGDQPFKPDRKGNWLWTTMIAQPEAVTKSLVETTIRDQGRKILRLAQHVRLEHLREGRSLQIEHVGPYSAEGPTIERLHEYAKALGLRFAGRHHEIYFNSPGRTVPEKLRTLIRQPVS